MPEKVTRVGDGFGWQSAFNSKKLDPTALVSNAELGGTMQLREWIRRRSSAR